MASETPEEAVDGLELTYPETDWLGFFKNHFGPSMLWALISIGASHIVLAPTLGGHFGLYAIWIFAVIYLAKYGAWELGIRYNYGVGRNPVEAYGDLPGPNNWMQWFTVLAFTVAYSGITAAVGMSTAAFVAALTPLSFTWAFVASIGLAGVLVVFTRYALLEKVLIAFTVALGAFVLVAVVVGPPSGDVVATAFSGPDLTGPLFIGLFAAAAGFAPTGFSTSVLIGSWSTAKGEGATELREQGLDPTDEAYHEYVGQWIRTGRRDFNIGYLFSFALIVAMVVLASNVLYPEPPADDNLALTIGSILSGSFGEWSYYAMAVGAFAALYSTVITLLDGASRAVSDALPLALERPEMDVERIRKAVVVGIVVASCAVVVALGTVPVTFLVWISAILAITEIAFYPANWYIVREHLPERFQPSTTWVIYYVLSLALVVVFGIMGAASEFGLV